MCDAQIVNNKVRKYRAIKYQISNKCVFECGSIKDAVWSDANESVELSDCKTMLVYLIHKAHVTTEDLLKESVWFQIYL